MSQLWTEKYKPQKIEEILGNKELVKRISGWLKDWYEPVCLRMQVCKHGFNQLLQI
jgi:hypothetical protein